MKNVKYSVKENKLLIEIDLGGETWAPKTGSSNRMLASTQGNTSIETPAGTVIVGLNAYYPG